MISQTFQFGKAIRPLFAYRVTFYYFLAGKESIGIKLYLLTMTVFLCSQFKTRVHCMYELAVMLCARN